jgi:tetratricopeptide (TPR) repeat protein
MQSADDRVKYLQSIMDSPRVAPPVRSFAAMRLAAQLSERMQNDLAGEAVAKAMQLNPLNLDALRVRYQYAMQNGQPQDRLAAELALLQSNPAQPMVVVAVARELADAGLVQRSLEWFRQALALHNQMGIVPGPDVGVDFAAEMFIAGDAKQALQVVEQITAANPDDLNAWLLKLTLARHLGDKELLAQTLQKATVAITNRMAMLTRAAGSTTATTRPIDFTGEVPLPDPMADLEQIQTNKPEMVSQYAPIAGGMAWLKIFFAENPGQAVPFTNAVAKVMGESNELTARLQGWQYLVAGNPDEARVKLAAVADRDSVAALGMIRLAEKDPAAQQMAVETARKLLERSPSRLTGAFLIAELGKRGVKVTPGPSAGELEKVLAQFPKDWMKILDQPQLFYTVRIEPVAGRVSVPVGEPVLVQVTIYNTSNFWLTMGPEGVIHPDLWFDAQTRGVQPQFFPAEAFARLGGPMLLAPKTDFVKQVVRLDQAQLLAMLERNPAAHFQIMALMMTNPTTVAGQVRPGPAGMQALSKLMERRGAPVGQLDVRQKLGEAIQNGTPEEKIQAAETLTKFARLFTGAGAGEEARAFGQQAAEAVRHTSTNDPDPAVRAWARYLYAVYSGDEQVLKNLLNDPTWIARTLGIVATDYTRKSQDLFSHLATTDGELLVKNLAAAALEAKIAAPKPGGDQAATQPAAPQPAASSTQPDAGATTGASNGTPAGGPAAELTPAVPSPPAGAAPPAPASPPAPPPPAPPRTPVTQPAK